MHLILQVGLNAQRHNGCTHVQTHAQKLLPLWVVGLQDKTPMCYSVKPLFMVLFLKVYKILGWTTPLLCVWKSHIWCLLVCHEWLWGIRANAVAWDTSYNNTDSFEGPTMTAKTTARAFACCIYWKHQTRCRGPVLCLLTNLSGCLPKAALRHELLLWHQRMSLCVMGTAGRPMLSCKKHHHAKTAVHARAFLLPREAERCGQNSPHVLSVLYDLQPLMHY